MVNSLMNFRLSLNLTQNEMSKQIGVTATYYSKIELGLRNPSYNFLVKFKKTFISINIDEIFFKPESHKTCI